MSRGAELHFENKFTESHCRLRRFVGGLPEPFADDGNEPLADIAAFRALGGDVIISFGGAAGTGLAACITGTSWVKMAYQFVIKACSRAVLNF